MFMINVVCYTLILRDNGTLEYWNSLWNTGHLTVLNTLFQDLMKGILTNPAFLGVWSPWKGRVTIPNLLSQCRSCLVTSPQLWKHESPATTSALIASPSAQQPRGPAFITESSLKTFWIHTAGNVFSSQNSLSQLQRKWQKKTTANVYQQLIPSTAAQLFVHGKSVCFLLGLSTTENWHCTSRDMCCLWQVRNVPKITPSGDKMKSRFCFLGACHYYFIVLKTQELPNHRDKKYILKILISECYHPTEWKICQWHQI